MLNYKWLKFHFKPLVLSILFIFTSYPALADAIDGDWCAKPGRHLKIDGPNFKTPGGNLITGEYDRHGFSYVVPEGETHASKTLDMQLQSDNLVFLTLPDGTIERWTRCDVVS